jgi:hypothetical protein
VAQQHAPLPGAKEVLDIFTGMLLDVAHGPSLGGAGTDALMLSAPIAADYVVYLILEARREMHILLVQRLG